jgi:phenylacetate-CoA ligase
MIELPGGELIGPRDVDDAVGADLPVDAYLLHQRADRTFTLRYLPSTPTARPDRELADRLRVLLGDDPRLTVEPADYIPSQRSGKFASCVTDVPPWDHHPTTDHTHGG